MKKKAELLVSAKRIYSVDASFSVFEAMAVGEDGRILAHGSMEDLESAFSFDRRLDFGQGFVYPGLYDPHCHFLSYGWVLGRAQLFGAKSWEEAVGRMVAHATAFPPAAGRGADAWVHGRGWDQNLWGGGFPDKRLLDAAFPHSPALAIRVDGHAAVANAEALRRAGIDGSTKIEGGTIGLERGEPTGFLVDNAVDAVRRSVPRPSRAQTRKALLAAQERCFSCGLTSVSNAGTEADEAEAMIALSEGGELSIGLYIMLMPSEENLRTWAQRGPLARGRLSVRSFKTFADGALGSRGAYLLEPYADDPGNRGLFTLDATSFEALCSLAREKGFQINTHAIGDAALRFVLDTYERHLRPGEDLRWRVEHAQIIADEDLPRFGRLGVVPCVQTSHATSDMAWTETRLGAWRMPRVHRYRELLEQTGWLPNGSDFPIEKIDPLRGFRSAAFGRDDAKMPSGGYLPGQRLTRIQALRAMTIWAAMANFEEGGRGSLEPGKLADLCVLDRDLLTADEDELWDVRVSATFAAGKLAYRSSD